MPLCERFKCSSVTLTARVSPSTCAAQLSRELPTALKPRSRSSIVSLSRRADATLPAAPPRILFHAQFNLRRDRVVVIISASASAALGPTLLWLRSRSVTQLEPATAAQMLAVPRSPAWFPASASVSIREVFIRSTAHSASTPSRPIRFRDRSSCVMAGFTASASHRADTPTCVRRLSARPRPVMRPGSIGDKPPSLARRWARAAHRASPIAKLFRLHAPDPPPAAAAARRRAEDSMPSGSGTRCRRAQAVM